MMSLMRTWWELWELESQQERDFEAQYAQLITKVGDRLPSGSKPFSRSMLKSYEASFDILLIEQQIR